jgi:hypothetical protein
MKARIAIAALLALSCRPRTECEVEIRLSPDLEPYQLAKVVGATLTAQKQQRTKWCMSVGECAGSDANVVCVAPKKDAPLP